MPGYFEQGEGTQNGREEAWLLAVETAPSTRGRCPGKRWSLLRGSLGLRAFVTMPGARLSCPGLRLAGGVLTKAAQD